MVSAACQWLACIIGLILQSQRTDWTEMEEQNPHTLILYLGSSATSFPVGHQLGIALRPLTSHRHVDGCYMQCHVFCHLHHLKGWVGNTWRGPTVCTGEAKLLRQSRSNLNSWDKFKILLISECRPTCNSVVLQEFLLKRKWGLKNDYRSVFKHEAVMFPLQY